MSNRSLEPGPIVAATHNSGKVRELNALLAPLGFEVTSAGELGLPVPDETETTFEGNAALKAVAAAKASNRLALADDSGLAVEALDGAPGVYTADWAGEPRDFYRAMNRVEAELQAREAANRRAKFVCVLCVAWPDGDIATFRGEVHGHLEFPPRGDRGFGYDPIFVADGETETFGEMDPTKKHAMSHRADAFAKLKASLLENSG